MSSELLISHRIIWCSVPGNQVVVAHLGAQKSGTVRYLGNEMDEQGDRIVRSAIVELDGEVPTAWRRANEASNYGGRPVMNGVLVPVQALRHNRSNGSAVATSYPISQPTTTKRTEEFGTMDSGVEKQKCGPAKDSLQLVGRQKGIQGYCNSCYLDATLYAMFVQTTVFDLWVQPSSLNCFSFETHFCNFRPTSNAFLLSVYSKNRWKPRRKRLCSRRS